MESTKNEKKKLSKGKKALIIILAIIAAIVIGELISINWHSNPENIVKYETDNPHIVDSDLPLVSAHRSGGGIAPEETMMAFKNCAENPGFDVDIFEFDLHITKDDVLVLLHMIRLTEHQTAKRFSAARMFARRSLPMTSFVRLTWAQNLRMRTATCHMPNWKTMPFRTSFAF